MLTTDLLIVGAGPFALSLAAQASHLGIRHLLVGKSMEFWHRQMPKGMYLRSACDWHLDPLNVHTIDNFVASLNKTPREVEPLSLEFYLSYVEWFRKQKDITPLPVYLERLDHDGDAHQFVATTTSGEKIFARLTAIAPGFKYFANVPASLSQSLPEGSFRHTSKFVDFSKATDKAFLIVGGRQSAFEWSALLLEAGAATVHVSHRHDTPKFTPSDWSWVNPIVDRMADNPKWYRQLTTDEKKELDRRLWAEGRLKLEPWLAPRLDSEKIKIWPNTEIASAERKANGETSITLTNNESFNVHEIVLATGYKVDIGKLPFLSSDLLGQIKTRDGFPVLDEHFQTSIPGLFITSMPAMHDFGPFFGFTIAVRTSARLICERLQSSSEIERSAST